MGDDGLVQGAIAVAAGVSATYTAGRCVGPSAIYWDPPINQMGSHNTTR